MVLQKNNYEKVGVNKGVDFGSILLSNNNGWQPDMDSKTKTCDSISVLNEVQIYVWL